MNYRFTTHVCIVHTIFGEGNPRKKFSFWWSDNRIIHFQDNSQQNKIWLDQF